MPELKIEAGDKVEIEKASSVLFSQVREIPEGCLLKVVIQAESAPILPLHREEEYELHLYTKEGVYTCTGKVADCYKEDTVFLAEPEIVSSPEKLQRRQFFRAECTHNIGFYALEEEELEKWNKNEEYFPVITDPNQWEAGMLVNISGGGAKIVSQIPLVEGTILFLLIDFLAESEQETVLRRLFAKVISSIELPKKPGNYEARLEFLRMNSTTREELIRFVFDEDWNKRKRERRRK